MALIVQDSKDFFHFFIKDLSFWQAFSLSFPCGHSSYVGARFLNFSKPNRWIAKRILEETGRRPLKL
jgi:hypothetical protein